MITLVRSAAGEQVLDESRLTARNRGLLVLFRGLIARGKSVEQIIQTLPPDIENGDIDVRKRLLDFFNLEKARILCLTETPSNNAMWWHYAGKASGCVLGFRTLPDSPWAEARKVEYFDVLPNLGSGVDMHLYGHTPEMLTLTMETVCYSKSSEWEYEKEWRMVTWRNNEPGLSSFFAFHSDELESITFGANTTPDTEAGIRALVRTNRQNCSFYRIETRLGETVRTKL